MKLKISAWFLLILTAAGCAHAPSTPKEEKRPEWTGGSASRFPPRLYMTGVGVGPNRRDAEDMARSEIAKSFKVRVLANSFDWMRSETLPGKQEETSQKVESMTSTSVDQVVEGISIPEIWEDKGNRTFYALAVLDRERTAAILRERINRLDGEISALMGPARGEGIYAGLREAVKAAGALQKRDIYNAELIVASVEGTGVPAAYRYAETQERINKVMSKVRLGINLTGDDTGEIRQSLIEGLSRAGFQVLTDPSLADILIRGDVRIRRVETPDSPWRWFAASLNGEVVNAQEGKYMGTIKEMSREGAQDKGQAIARTLNDLSMKVAEGIRREIIRSVTGSNE